MELQPTKDSRNKMYMKVRPWNLAGGTKRDSQRAELGNTLIARASYRYFPYLDHL
jgi:hypothetical protein